MKKVIMICLLATFLHAHGMEDASFVTKIYRLIDQAADKATQVVHDAIHTQIKAHLYAHGKEFEKTFEVDSFTTIEQLRKKNASSCANDPRFAQGTLSMTYNQKDIMNYEQDDYADKYFTDTEKKPLKITYQSD